MNIYILVEISKREFDSNLLIAFLSALNGHEVIISNFENYSFLNSISMLKPGIFHTKSIVHGIKKKNFHNSLKKKNFLITSIDEEAGLINKDYTSFSETRFSNDALSVVDKIFCWGQNDYQFLKKKFPIHEKKFTLSGSPRIDLSKKFFSKYWNPKIINNKEKKENILFALNFPVVNGYIVKEKIYSEMKKQGFFERSKIKEQEYLDFVEDSNKSFLAFKNLINFLSKELKNYKFIIRPHPMEKIETWKKLLQENINVEINNDNDVNYDLDRSKILIHNGCTTAFQAALKDLPILSYKPYKGQSDYGSIANQLGKMVFKKEDIKKEIIKLMQIKDFKIDDYINKKILSFRIHLSEEFSSKNIINSWLEISNNLISERNNWVIVRLYLQIFSLFKLFREYLLFIIKPFKKKTENYYYRKKKFEDINIEEVRSKISRLKKIFNKDEKIIVEKLSSKFFLIKKI